MKLGIIGCDKEKDLTNGDRIRDTFNQVLSDFSIHLITTVTNQHTKRGRSSVLAHEFADRAGLPIREHFLERNTAHYTRKRNTLFIDDTDILLVDLPKQYKSLKDVYHSNHDYIAYTIKHFLKIRHERYLYLVV